MSISKARIRLIIRGDDSGLCGSVNEAVVKAYDKGVLRNTSLQVPAPAFADAVLRFRNLPDLCIGLHATINAEWETPRWGPLLPAARVPSLTDENGLFQSGFGHAAPDEIMEEVKAQLAAARAAGLKISYIDEHCCFGWLHDGGLRRRMARLAESEGLIYDSMAVGWLPKAEGLFPTLTAAFIAQIEAAPPGLYRHVLHLGQDLPDMQELRFRGDAKSVAGSIARERDTEFRLCINPELISYAASHDVEFIRFSDLTPAEIHWFTHG